MQVKPKQGRQKQPRQLPAASEVDNASSTKDGVEEMLNIAGGVGPFICSLCLPPRTFKNSTGFRNHAAWKHCGTNSKPAARDSVDGYECDLCGAAIRGYAALATHKLKKHNVEQLHRCTLCDATFNKLRIFNSHMSAAHGVLAFKCATCGAEFKSREGWRIHELKQHSQGLISSCIWCHGYVYHKF